MDIVALIQQKYGDNCQLCSPLMKDQYEEAHRYLPDDLFKIIQISNGINETMINPNTNKTEVIYEIIYSFSEIKEQTSFYLCENDSEGFVFAGNGAGGYYILKPDGRVFIFEDYDVGEEYCANSLWDFFNH